MLTIRPFVEGDTQEIIRLILHFQNDGTRPPVTVADQPDLLSISQTYIRPGGNFWVARDGAQLAGTIGLMRHGADQAVLKKFFVYEPYQGAPHHTGRRLYATLLTFARERGVRTLVLDTPRNTPGPPVLSKGRVPPNCGGGAALPLQPPLCRQRFFLLEL